MAVFYTQWPAYITGERISIGDWVKVYVPSLGVWHHGIVRWIYPVVGGLAVTIADNRKESGIAVSDWHDFAGGNVVMLERRASSIEHVRQIVARVDANMGRPYYLFAQNCEHFASFAFTGRAESKSLQVLTGIAAAGLLFGALYLAE